MKVATVMLDNEEMYFASLDGEVYIGTSRRAEQGEEKLIADLIAGDGKMKPMLAHKRFLQYNSDSLEIIEV